MPQSPQEAIADRRPIVALTGASGFIGCRLLPRLLETGSRVRALTRNSPPSDREGNVEWGDVEWVRGSLSDEASLRRLVEGAEVVVHCAGAIKAAAPAAFHEINVAGTVSLAAVAAAQKKPPRFFLFSSLAAREPGLSDYAATKRQAEAELARHYAGHDWLALRPPAVYGPGDRMTLALFKAYARGRSFVPRAKGNRVSLIFIDDLVEAVIHLLRRPAWNGAVIELDDGHAQGYSWADLAEIAGRHLGRKVATYPLPRSLLWLPAVANQALAPRFGRVPMLTPGKLRELFHDDWVCRRRQGTPLDGWHGNVTFDQGFPRTLAWYKDKGWL